jgi:hypothetical protein
VSKCSVYGLAGPDGVVRYIGQTRGTLKYRLGTHWRDAKRRPHSKLYRWMRATKAVSIVLLSDNCTWDETEVAVIAAFRKAHPGVLLNTLAGGADKPAKQLWRKKKRGSKRAT